MLALLTEPSQTRDYMLRLLTEGRSPVRASEPADRRVGQREEDFFGDLNHNLGDENGPVERQAE